MVIVTIFFTIAILSLSVAVFMVSRDLVKLRDEVTSLHIELTMTANAVDACFKELRRPISLGCSFLRCKALKRYVKVFK